MTAVEQAQARYESERRTLISLRDELTRDDVTEERRGEIGEQMDRCHAVMSEARDDVKRLQATDALIDQRMVRRDVNIAGTQPSERRDFTPPTVEQIRERGELQWRETAGLPITDEEIAIANRRFPVEDLWGRYTWLRAIGRLDLLPTEQAEAYRGYRDNMETALAASTLVQSRAITGGLDGTANDGADFVPTDLERTIHNIKRFVGPMADDSRLSVFRLDYYGNLTVPTGTAAAAADSAPAADLTITKPTTGSVTFTAKKYGVVVPVTAEIMMSPVNFQSWFNSQVARSFGRTFNNQRTVGDGSGRNFAGAWAGAAATRVSSAANDTLAAADLLSLFKGLGSQYYGPDTSVQMNGDIELELMKFADGSGSDTVAYIRIDPVTGEVRLPRGLRAEINDAFTGVLTGNNTLKWIGIGDLSQYGIYYAMGMRSALQYIAESDQWLLTFLQWTDGQRMDEGAFRSLHNAG